MKNYSNIDELKKLSVGDPRIHGNGFLQLDLSKDKRLHVWHPDLPKQKNPTPIHNHNFSFKSSVIYGELTHITYEIVVNEGEYNLYYPVIKNGQNTILVKLESGSFWDLKETAKYILSDGSTYFFNHTRFHQNYSDYKASTIMEKTFKGNTTPYVACPKEYEPSNEFDRHSFDTNYLWAIIDEICTELDGEDKKIKF